MPERWRPPFTVNVNNKLGTEIVTRAERFLRELFSDVGLDGPLQSAQDLHRYLKGLPVQGDYYAESALRCIRPPSRSALVQVTVIGARSLRRQKAEQKREREEDDAELLLSWRQKLEASGDELWELILEAVTVNSRSS